MYEFTEEDKKKCGEDFPKKGRWNWVLALLRVDDLVLNGAKALGILLKDGRFLTQKTVLVPRNSGY